MPRCRWFRLVGVSGDSRAQEYGPGWFSAVPSGLYQLPFKTQHCVLG